MTKLYLIRGLPGSGKSTIAAALGVEVYEADQYFMVDGVYRYDSNRVHAAHRWCQTRTMEALRGGRSVAVANTFTLLRDLRPYFEIAKELGIVPTVIKAENTFQNIHGVPQETLDRYRKRWQDDLSPLFAMLENENDQG